MIKIARLRTRPNSDPVLICFFNEKHFTPQSLIQTVIEDYSRQFDPTLFSRSEEMKLFCMEVRNTRFTDLKSVMTDIHQAGFTEYKAPESLDKSVHILIFTPTQCNLVAQEQEKGFSA